MNIARTLATLVIALTMAAWLAVPALSAQGAAAADWPSLQPARRLPNATSAPMLAAARAGSRVVAVGDHGVVLLSDDGAHFRQAQSVPVRSLLTSVQFLDAQRGYAAGHDGVVLATRDGGETWTLLRSAPATEQPILALHFDDAEHGIAVGLYGWAVETHDGGRSWTALQVESGENSDRHLLHIFASGHGTLFIAGEGGIVYRSADRGRSWQAVATGNKGSLWHGRALADGSLLVCGMRGHLYRSADDGRSWQRVEANTSQSLTGITELADGRVIVVGLAGTLLESRDAGRTFTTSPNAASGDLTTVLADGLAPLLLSMTGPQQRASPAAR